MRNMLAFLAALVITLGAIGFYLDWFNIRRISGTEGNTSFQFDVNTNKIGEDFRKAEEKLQKRLAEKSKTNSPESPRQPSSAEQKSHHPSLGKQHHRWFEMPPQPTSVSDLDVKIER